jgi:WD40 repeat protein
MVHFPATPLCKWDLKTGKAALTHRLWPTGVPPAIREGLELPEPEPGFNMAFAMGAAFSPRGDVLAVASEFGQLHFFEVATGKDIRVMNLGGDRPKSFSLSFSATGKYLAFRQRGSPLNFLHLATGVVRFTIELPLADGSIAVSPDERLVAAICGDKLMIVETASGKIRQTLENLPGKVRQVMFSPDSRVLATAMADSTAIVWDLQLLATKATGK